MTEASYVRTSFLGGEWSPLAQGQFTLPVYQTAMNVCYNGLPLEAGAWTRRPGTKEGSLTRNGMAGRLVNFDFEQTAPYNIEMTAGYIRFFSGPDIVVGPAISVLAISGSSVTIPSTMNLVSGQQVRLFNLGNTCLNLHNRTFQVAAPSPGVFTLVDPITGNVVTVSTPAYVSGATVSVITEIVTPYAGDLWTDVRVVQTNRQAANGSVVEGVFLSRGIKPQVLSVVTPPTDEASATFTFAAANFKDGPYFDVVPGGTLASPSAKNGLITVTLSFNAYDATRAYSVGDYVTSSSVNYKSLVDGNLNNTPASSPIYWVTVSAADAIGPSGFLGTDTGRHVRLFSEPAIWLTGSTYAKDDVVAYGGTGARYSGAVTYWKSLVNTNTGNQPGIDITKWAVNPTAAIWTWGRVTGLTNVIDRALAGSTSVGDMSSGGGLNAVFDGIFSKASTASAERTATGSVSIGSDPIALSSYVGKNYTGASNQTIAQATIYPSSDQGFSFGTFTNTDTGASGALPAPVIVFNLYGKASAPSSSSDGTLLGTVTAGNSVAPITITSSDIATAWKYVWVEIAATTATSQPHPANYSITNAAAQLSLFAPPGAGSSQGFTMQIIGDPLLYTSPIRTWRLGLYSDTTGWPAAGTYHEGRLWLTGAVGNRIDSSEPSDPYTMSPTEPNGTVTGNNGISYVFNSPDVNPIHWMTPDQQGIVCGTQAGEWLVQATTLNSPLTALNIQAHRITKVGCANIEPRRAPHAVLFVQRHKRKLIEYFADFFSGKFGAQNLTERASHITAPYIAEIAYQDALTPIIWSRMDDGSLAGCTYRRETLSAAQPPDFKGWHRQALGSTRSVQSICVGASANGPLDALAMVTLDTVANLYHVEVLTDVPDENLTPESAWFLDAGVEPSVITSNVVLGGNSFYQLSGLWAHNGKTVSVWSNGYDCGDVAVANGQCNIRMDQVPAAAFTAPITCVVGFTYTSQGQLVRPATPAESGAKLGPALGAKRRTDHVKAQLYKAGLALQFGTDFAPARLKSAKLQTAGGAPLPGNTLFSGVHWDNIVDPYSYDSMLAWQITRPYPATIVSIGANLSTQG